MRNLLDFLVKYSSWIVFAFYVIVSCIFLFDKNPYQHHVYMTSAGQLASSVYEFGNSVTSYFNLRDINEDLQAQNARLESEVVKLREQINLYAEREYADSMTVDPVLQEFSFVISRVINNSIHRPYNYITIDKGEVDGVKPEMGVVDQNGVVGIVNIVGKHNSRIISLLNPNFRLSCKVKGNDAFGSLVWDGKDYTEAILEELPRHTVYSKGDTIITSGYSAVFPEGIPVGVIIGRQKTIDDNFFTLRIRLLSDFSHLSTVRVISSNMLNEIRQIETDPDDKTE